ncbi:MAG: hypothetical protein Q8K75_05165 [Chlamydiales bacterium]|nr:hypothetical protein [Chlamydiales bacterium]
MDDLSSFQLVNQVTREQSFREIAQTINPKAYYYTKKLPVPVSFQRSPFPRILEAVTGWNDCLSRQYTITFIAPLQISSLQQIIAPILANKSLSILREKMPSDQVEIDNTLQLVEDVISKIMSAHMSTQIVLFPLRFIAVLNHSEQEARQIKRQFIIDLFAETFSNSQWESKIGRHYDALSSPEQLEAAAAEIENALQAMAVINHALLTKSDGGKLATFFAFLSTPVAFELLYSWELQTVHRMTLVLKPTEWESWRNLSRSAIDLLEQDIIAAISVHEQSQFIEMPHISGSQINVINELRNTLVINRKISQNLAYLLEKMNAPDWLQAPLKARITIHIENHSVPNRAIARLQATAHEDRPPSPVNQRLYEPYNDEPVVELLSLWNICYPSDCREYGLLPKYNHLSNEEFEELVAKGNTCNFFKEAIEYLNTFGIIEGGDLTKKGIIGPLMLKEYLEILQKKET